MPHCKQFNNVISETTLPSLTRKVHGGRLSFGIFHWTAPLLPATLFGIGTVRSSLSSAPCLLSPVALMILLAFEPRSWYGSMAIVTWLSGIVDKKDDASSSTNEMYLDCEAFLAIHRTISPEVFKSISTCKSAHEVWTKLEDIYGGSNLDEDDIMMKKLVHELFTLFDHKESTTTSISDCLHTSSSSISQGNDMPKHIHKIKDFMLTVCRKDARSVRIKRTKDDAVKFKERVGADQEDQGCHQVQGALLHVPLHALRLRHRQSQQAQAVPPTRDGKVASEIDMLSLPYYIPPFGTMVVVAGGYSKVDVAIRMY
ncbi:ribosomal protein [Hordeum vulgare]|nr:ribosomal protein [Hordeum vulgare]